MTHPALIPITLSLFVYVSFADSVCFKRGVTTCTCSSPPPSIPLPLDCAHQTTDVIPTVVEMTTDYPSTTSAVSIVTKSTPEFLTITDGADFASTPTTTALPIMTTNTPGFSAVPNDTAFPRTTTVVPTVTKSKLEYTHHTTDVPKVPDMKTVHYCPGCCKNGGVCGRDGVCRCPFGYTGRYCETAICQPTCKNDGKCIAPNKCHCLTGYSGADCSQAHCRRLCLNGGRCVGADTCVCPRGYVGSQCKFIYYSQGYCQNGGVCGRDGVCQCPVGYTGRYCETAYCRQLCLNGGRCVGADTCMCPRGYFGPQCYYTYCRRLCLHGGRCVGVDTCMCPRGYFGPQCQFSKCPGGCASGSVCVGFNICFRYYPSSQNWCMLQSYRQAYAMTYVKPVIQTYRISCGFPTLLQTCESARLIYKIYYRTSLRVVYRCSPYG